MKISFIICTFIILVIGHLDPIHPQSHLNFTDYCRYFSYPYQVHDVRTEDGYILGLFRIQKKKSQIIYGLPVIFLQHGLLDSSDTWIINDQDKAIAFIFANKGYDVWLGNSRGNKYSRRHTQYDPDKNSQFWMFTFQHMADQDLPAIFKYVNGKTGKKINYIGHSQGTIQMHIALSKNNPVIQSLLDKYFAFGPVAYANHQKSPIVQFLIKAPVLQWYNRRHIYQFMPGSNWFQTEAGIIFCAEFVFVCQDLLKYLMDADPTLDNYDRADVLAGHQPSGTSVLNMAHWKQIAESGKFQAFDYGSPQQNIKHYGSVTPPVWNLANIRVNIRLFAGDSDLLADLNDVNHLWSSLNPTYKTFLKIYNAGHVTFIWGKDIQPWMNDLYRML